MTPQPPIVRDKHMEVALKIYKWFGREPFEPEGLAAILAREYTDFLGPLVPAPADDGIHCPVCGRVRGGP